MKNKMNKKHIIILSMIVILFSIPYMSPNPYYLIVLINMFVSIMYSSSFRLVARAGQVTAGHAAFAGIGGYTSALLVTKLQWNFWYSLPLAGIMTGLIGLGVGYPSLRLKGIYFAIITFGLGEVVRLIWHSQHDVFGGPGGLTDIPSPNAIGSWEFGSISSLYLLGLFLTLLTLTVMYMLDKSRFGLILRSIEESDVLGESIGINTMRYKVLAFFIACFATGIAGAYFAHQQHCISPEDFAFLNSAYIIVYAVVGGLGSVWGPVWGVFVLLGVPVVLRFIPNYNPLIEPLIFGGILVMVMLFLPGGVVTLPEKILSVKNRKLGLKPKGHVDA